MIRWVAVILLIFSSAALGAASEARWKTPDYSFAYAILMLLAGIALQIWDEIENS